ncbi:MAG: cupredoxin domain-containing protein [Nitrososphaerales archaeon]
MSKPKGSVGVALAIAVLIIIAVTSVGYYQFVLCKPTSCATSTSTSAATTATGCTAPSCVTIQIVAGAALLTNTAYSPDVATLVVGVNNTFDIHNNDSQSGGVFHSATADTCPKVCPFDTGIIAYNTTMGPFTITVPGTYAYYCEVHPTTMVGKIIVVAGSGSSSNSTAASSSSTSTTSSKSSAPANGLAISILHGSWNNQASLGYSPANVTVVVGANNSVTWTNNDTVGHTVTFSTVPSGATVSSSELIGPNEMFTVSFTVPGTYHYFDTSYPWMKGTIVVKGA